MGTVCYIYSEELDKYNNFKPLMVLKTVEDVSTLVEVFELATLEISVSQIKDVLSDESGNYIFLLDGNKNKFDLYGYINKKYNCITNVNCVNAKLLFPRSKSRGIYTVLEGVDSSSDLDMEETPTGFLGEEDLLELNSIHYLYYKKADERVKITNEITIVGRSSIKSDYVIHGNGNISRGHFGIRCEEGVILVKDMGSVNGTYVNGNKIISGCWKHVEVGDIIRIAGEELTVE